MDTSEAKKNLNKYSDELNRYQNLSRTVKPRRNACYRSNHYSTEKQD
ncbi:hypothetical protein [Acinetobacter nosocomialis]|nr:hypothetical protein [Acinetobacter nosocomialis]MBR7715512.1 hypothetical protein [Acinetobacter nosocomialis]